MRPCWRRLWVTQEIILAKKITIYCGASTLPWESLSSILQYFNHVEIVTKYDHTGVPKPIHVGQLSFAQKIKSSMATTIVHGRDDHRLHPEPRTFLYGRSMLYLVLTHQHGQCSDPRDKVYALHGFALNCCRTAVPADYNGSIDDLYNRVLQHDLSCHLITDGEALE